MISVTKVPGAGRGPCKHCGQEYQRVAVVTIGAAPSLMLCIACLDSLGTVIRTLNSNSLLAQVSA